ncbi:MAG TPA: DUF4401 domain-containing protein [Edaphocola sp.]|nr:DUF4401 domain-containing protein [Edaphocola sp.]
MSNKEVIKELLDCFQNEADTPLEFDEEAILLAYQKEDQKQSISIKILSIFGGILASIAFLGFLFISGLYSSDISLLVLGGVLIVTSIWLNKKSDRIVMDTFSVSAFIIGFILLGFGCLQFKVSDNILSIIFIIIAFASLNIVQNYILSFIAVLIINGSILTLIISNNLYNIIPIYIAAIGMMMTYLFLKEGKIITINKTLSKLYNPVKIGLIFSFLIGLIFLGKKGILPIDANYNWLSSIIIIPLIVYIITILFKVINVQNTSHKIGIYIFTILILLSTALSPAISGAFLIILLSFFVNYKTGFVIGIISFIYFIFQFYYDLNFTLLTKSIILFSTGLLFIVFYLFTYKKLKANENV